MKYLHLSTTIENFINWYNSLKINNWQIMTEDIERRKKAISSKDYYQELNYIAKKQEIVFDDTEIISWLDSLLIMKKILSKLNELQNFSNMKIIQELHIPFTNKRADYVLVKDNKILIIEFSFANWNISYRYEYKLNQAIGYKECLQNVLPNHIKIGTYTYIINPEQDELNIENIINFITAFFKQKQDAFTELEKI